MSRPLQWSLVIATFNRRDVLRSCVELAVRQSRPPVDVAICDASADWQETRDELLDTVAPIQRSVRWHYLKATVLSSATQRNEAVRAASGDVFFMLDDDSLLYPECAARVMKVYEQDSRRGVAGVGPAQLYQPPAAGVPADPGDSTPTEPSAPSLLSRGLEPFRGLLDVDRLLLPYDHRYPDHPVPDELVQMPVVPTRYLNGFRMTWRADFARSEPFDESLQRWAAAEDMDVSYRMSRHGVLLNLLDAHVYHAQSPSARHTRYTRTLLGQFNLAFLYRRNGYNPDRLLRQYRGRLRQRLLVDLLRDAARSRWSMPCARADWRALQLTRQMSRIDDATLLNWFADRQAEILDAAKA